MIRKSLSTQTPRTYQYRFMPDNTIVYYITKHVHANVRPQISKIPLTIYSEPYYSKERNEQTNSVVCYNNIDTAIQKCNSINEIHANCEIDSILLRDLKYYTLLLRMPLLLEINSYCDIRDYNEYVDVYYYNKKMYNMSEIFNIDTM